MVFRFYFRLRENCANFRSILQCSTIALFGLVYKRKVVFFSEVSWEYHWYFCALKLAFCQVSDVSVLNLFTHFFTLTVQCFLTYLLTYLLSSETRFFDYLMQPLSLQSCSKLWRIVKFLNSDLLSSPPRSPAFLSRPLLGESHLTI